ncbi:MAG: hydrogenase maturation protease [Terriglobales bacterium]|jgi:hydrogenase maturation protease
MPSCLIVGFGNPLRSDDGVGLKAAAAIERELASSSTSASSPSSRPLLSSLDVVVLAGQQLTPEMSEAVGCAERVLFLDASHAGAAGEIRLLRIRRDPAFDPGSLSHDLEPSSLLELAARYFQAEPKAWLLTLTGENFELGERFSPAVEGAWNAYLERIRSWISGL